MTCFFEFLLLIFDGCVDFLCCLEMDRVSRLQEHGGNSYL